MFIFLGIAKYAELLLTREEREEMYKRPICHICKKPFKPNSVKHIDHSHIDGEFSNFS